MGWVYRVLGGTAAGLGGLAVAGGLLAVFGVTPPAGVGWLMLALAGAMLVGVLGTGLIMPMDKALAWSAFQCLSLRTRVVLGVLGALGVLLATPLAEEGGKHGNLQDPQARDGVYHAYRPQQHPGLSGTVELTRPEYLALVRDENRALLGTAGALLAGAACASLTAGELRRTAPGGRTAVKA